MTACRILPAGPDGISAAADRIRSGGVVVYPTETVYGIGADPFDRSAVDRVFSLKGRDASKGLILLLRGEQDLDRLVDPVPDCGRRLMRAFWPGPLTLVLPARPELSPDLLGGLPTVAVRVSDNRVCRALAERVGGPITSTSANRSGCPPATSAEEAAAALGADVDLILDGGPAPDDTPSTLLDLTQSPPAVLRAGRITETDIRRTLS
jgi:L-threonylcarbamoyladenylate synthase